MGSDDPNMIAPAFMMPGVSLFASGTFRGKRWSPGDLRQMAKNAKRLGPNGMKLLVPPAVLGHEESSDQDYLNRTDLPAAGWIDPDSVSVVPDPENPGEAILKGDVVNIPEEIADRLDKGEYKFGSIECYDDFTDDFDRSYGKTIRRFALLGGEVPQVKRLYTLPPTQRMTALRQFAERCGVVVRERRVRQGDVVHTYAETTVMDRNELVAAIQAAMPKLSKATLDAMSDDALMDMVNSLPAGSATADPNAAVGGMPGMAMAEGDEMVVAGPTRDEMVAELKASGLTEEELAGMSDDELAAMLDELDAQDAAAMAEGEGEEEKTEEEKAEEEAAADEEKTEDEKVEEMAEPGDREGMIAELVAAGQDAALLDAMPDDQLAALYAEVIGNQVVSPPAEAAMAEPGDREGMIAELVAAGQGAATLDAMPDDQLAALYAEVIGNLTASPLADAAMKEPQVGSAVAMGTYKTPTRAEQKAMMARSDDYYARGQQPAKPRKPMSDKQIIKSLDLKMMSDKTKGKTMTRCSETVPAGLPKRLRRVFSELDVVANKSLKRARFNEQRAARREAELKRKTVDAFCEQLVRHGKATPALVKALHKPLLLQLDDTHAVHKFTESGRTTRLTALERKMKELEKLPAFFQFGERFGKGMPEQTTDEAEAAKVREFAATLSDSALKNGQYASRENFVEKFCEARKKKPGLTAREYLGPTAFEAA